MKFKLQFIALLLPVVLISACQLDNYGSPKSRLTGALLYQGDSIRVATNQVTFELWQSGFGKLTPIYVNVAQNGSYSALLFKGNYKLIIPAGSGPFMDQLNSKTNSDTLLVSVKGDQSQNINVIPYYLIQNPNFTLNKSDSTVAATCKLQKIITDANAQDVQSISLYINKTAFVDNSTNIKSTTINGADITNMNSISLNAKVPSMIPTQNYVFARIGVKINNVGKMIYSPVVKMQF
ncbi:MAG TPA: DUF3823 domain-containing protein [Balneolales bacterium]|nr:DUF3823 domain-containing protein [Balneolales bacterium]